MAKLTRKVRNRCEPIFETDPDGNVWIVGYKRGSRSRRNETWTLREKVLHQKAPLLEHAQFVAMEPPPNLFEDEVAETPHRVWDWLKNKLRRKKEATA